MKPKLLKHNSDVFITLRWELPLSIIFFAISVLGRPRLGGYGHYLLSSRHSFYTYSQLFLNCSRSSSVVNVWANPG